MSGFSFLPPALKYLIGANVAVYLIQLLFGKFQFGNGISINEMIFQYFALWPVTHPFFYAWQFFSYMFLHEGFMHILFNMFALWMFGVEVEQTLGTRRFLIFYLLCGLGGGLAHLIMSGMLGIEGGPLIGASGAIFGVMVAFALMFPDRYIYFYFILPIRAKYLVAAWIGIEVFSTVGAGDNVSHLAHLGGALTGIIYMLILGRVNLANFRRSGGIGRSQWSGGRSPQSRGTGFFNRSPKPRQSSAVDAEYRDIDQAHSPVNTGNASNVGQSRVITQEEIDRILDKIAATGYQNLTDEERDILFEASKRMEERR